MTCFLLSAGTSWAKKDEFLNMWGAVLIGKGYGSLMAEAVTSAQNLRSASIEFSRSIGASRQQFCSTFPDKPGHEQASQKFAKDLADKDFYYLAMTLILGDSPQGKVIEAISGGMDGGIPNAAQREFAIWIGGMQEYFRQSGGGVPSMNDVLGALQATESKQQKYRYARDIAEIQRCGFKLPPEIYTITLFNRHMRLNSYDDAIKIYNGMVDAFGEQNVINASNIVANAPLDSKGKVLNIHQYGLYELGRRGQNTDDAPIGLNPIIENNQYLVMVGILENGSPRAYLLSIIKDSQNNHDWDRAIATYNQFVNQYGESAVLSASEKVMKSQKNIRDGWILQPNLIGATNSIPYDAFQQIVNPATYKDPGILLEEANRETARQEELIRELRIIEDKYASMSPLPDNRTINDLCRRYSREANNGPEYTRCAVRFGKLKLQEDKMSRKKNNTYSSPSRGMK